MCCTANVIVVSKTSIVGCYAWGNAEYTLHAVTMALLKYVRIETEGLVGSKVI